MSERRLLMIPGPIEFEPAVLRAMGEKTRGHLDPVFVASFSRTIKRLRDVFQAPTAQPFVVAGSGTLAMEMAVANLIERGDKAVVVNSGYFSDRIGSMLERHGAQVTSLKSEPGSVVGPAELEKALNGGNVKVVTITHVDTSTAVLAPVKELAAVAKKYDALVVVDGVCSVGGEALAMDSWGIDVTFTASQKALGAPPGLGVLLASPKAMAAFKARKTKVAAMYLDFAEWLPIHEAYEAEKPSYFATPPVNLIMALDVSLGQLLTEGMEARVLRHQKSSLAMQAAWKALGLESLPKTEALKAHTLSAVYFPASVDVSLVKIVAGEGVVIAGGLHPDLKTKYFRVGHMGAVSKSDLVATVGAIERGLSACGYRFDAGAGVAALQAAFRS